MKDISELFHDREKKILKGQRILGLNLEEAENARIFNAYLSINAQEDTPTNPEHLYHIEQVYLVGMNILNTMLAPTDENVKKVTEKAFSHDMGRAWDNGLPHLLFGHEALLTLKADLSLAEYAIDHHKWGLIAYEDDIIAFLSDEQPNIEDIGMGEKDTILEHLFETIYDKFTAKYGIEGIIILLADCSKTYSDSTNVHMPNIALFDDALGRNLIKSQLKKQRYLINSRDHLIEVVGTRFALYVIHRLTKDQDVDYNKAIDSALKEWPNQIKKVDQAWEAALELNNEVYKS